jgi:5'-nucleotidase
MKHLHFGISKGIVASVTGALALATALVMTLPSNAAIGLDTPTTGVCTTTLTGTHSGTINVPAAQTFCLVHLTQVGAVNVAAGGALSVTLGSNITGAITLVGTRSFAFCSSTIVGAIKSSTAAGFVLIGSGRDGVLCGGSTINGAVTLNGNLGGVEVGGNAINAALTVSGNVAPDNGFPIEDNATEVEANTVKGLTTCAGNTPAPTNDGEKNTFTGGAGGQCAGL